MLRICDTKYSSVGFVSTLRDTLMESEGEKDRAYCVALLESAIFSALVERTYAIFRRKVLEKEKRNVGSPAYVLHRIDSALNRVDRHFDYALMKVTEALCREQSTKLAIVCALKNIRGEVSPSFVDEINKAILSILTREKCSLEQNPDAFAPPLSV